MANIKSVRNWFDAHTLLGNKNSKTIGHNTVLHRGQGNSFYVTLHGNRIVTFFPGGAIEYSNAGWHTVTTRDRLNQLGFSNVSFFQEKHEQFVHIGVRGPNYWSLGETRKFNGRVVIVPSDNEGEGQFS